MELQNAERTPFTRVQSGSSEEASSVEEEVPEGRTDIITSDHYVLVSHCPIPCATDQNVQIIIQERILLS